MIRHFITKPGNDCCVFIFTRYEALPRNVTSVALPHETNTFSRISKII